jgi:hypothetical protein
MALPDTTLRPPHTAPPKPEIAAVSLGLTWAAFVVALIALAGSLWLSLGMNLKACPLCYYERTFVMAAAGVLAVGLLTGARRYTLLSLFALPPAVAGLSVAAWHEYQRASGAMECPKGVFGFSKAPQESLAVLTLLCILLIIDVARSRQGGLVIWPSVGLAAVIGVLLTVGAVRSVSPPPGDYGRSVDEDGCRPIKLELRPDLFRLNNGPRPLPFKLPLTRQVTQTTRPAPDGVRFAGRG